MEYPGYSIHIVLKGSDAFITPTLVVALNISSAFPWKYKNILFVIGLFVDSWYIQGIWNNLLSLFFGTNNKFPLLKFIWLYLSSVGAGKRMLLKSINYNIYLFN